MEIVAAALIGFSLGIVITLKIHPMRRRTKEASEYIEQSFSTIQALHTQNQILKANVSGLELLARSAVDPTQPFTLNEIEQEIKTIRSISHKVTTIINKVRGL